MAREKRIEGIADIWDESNREGMRDRHRAEARRDPRRRAQPALEVSPTCRRSFGANMLAINGGRPEQMNLKDILRAFNAFREEVVAQAHQVPAQQGARPRPRVGRSRHRRRQHRRGHQPDPPRAVAGRGEGAADDARLAGARTSPCSSSWSPTCATRSRDAGTYRLSAEQAQAILDLRLQRLTALGRDEIGEDLKKIAEEIKDYLEILGSRARIVDIVTRRTRRYPHAVRHAAQDRDRRDRRRGRGRGPDPARGRGRHRLATRATSSACRSRPIAPSAAAARAAPGMSTRDEDFVTQIFITSTHTPVMFFSSRGMCYRMKVWRLPAATPQSPGKALINLLPLQQDEVITTILPLPEDEATWGELELMFATRSGNVRRNSLSRLREHQSQRQDRDEARRRTRAAGDRIIDVAICRPDGRRAADHRRRPGDPLRRARTCACSRAAIPTACAASASATATT